jgi:hypothetical protein
MRKLQLFLFLIGFSSSMLAQNGSVSDALAGRIDTYLNSTHTSAHPLAGHGSVFVSQGLQYSTNPRFIVAISGNETSFGVHICGTDNAFNWFWNGSCSNSPFDSWDSGIHTVSHFMQKSYILHGYTTIPTIAKKYCTTGCSSWIPLVERFYADLGGDPTAAVSWTGDAPGQESGAGTPEPAESTPSPTPEPGEATLMAELKDVTRSGTFLSSDRTVTFTVVATAQDLEKLKPSTTTLMLDGAGASTVLHTMSAVPGTVGTANPQYQATVTIPEKSLDQKTLGVVMKLRNGTSKKITQTLHTTELTIPAASHTALIAAVCGFLGLLFLGGIGFAIVQITGHRKAVVSSAVSPAAPPVATPIVSSGTLYGTTVETFHAPPPIQLASGETLGVVSGETVGAAK